MGVLLQSNVGLNRKNLDNDVCVSFFKGNVFRWLSSAIWIIIH